MYEIDFRSEKGGDVKRLVWSTDLHLDAAQKSEYSLFLNLVSSYEPDFFLIGGDISNGVSCLLYLQQLLSKVSCPIYFVLGNHDFYYGSIYAIREKAKHVAGDNTKLHYLTDSGVYALSETTGLIGHDGWTDAGAGDFMKSEVMLNDYYLIDELKKLNQEERKEKLEVLGKEAAKYFAHHLEKAFQTYDKMVLLTHIPPFQRACVYDGKMCDVNWAPHFVNYYSGVELERIMRAFPNKELLVLCGHTHSGIDVQLLPNLRVVAAQTELGMPNVQGLILVN